MSGGFKRPSTPVRPLFEWARDEQLLADYDRAQKKRAIAQYDYRRAPRGQKQTKLKALQKAAHTCLKIETELNRRTQNAVPK